MQSPKKGIFVCGKERREEQREETHRGDLVTEVVMSGRRRNVNVNKEERSDNYGEYGGGEKPSEHAQWNRSTLLLHWSSSLYTHPGNAETRYFYF